MRRFSFRFLLDDPRIGFVALFVFGLFSGFFAAHLAGQSLISVMRAVPLAPVSIVSMSAVMLLPFLLAVIAAFLKCTWFIPVLAFLKAFSFSCCIAGLYLAFGRAAYLLLLFSDFCAVPLFCLFCLQYIRNCRSSLLWGLAICGMLVLLAVCVDVQFVSPYLASL